MIFSMGTMSILGRTALLLAGGAAAIELVYRTRIGDLTNRLIDSSVSTRTLQAISLVTGILLIGL